MIGNRLIYGQQNIANQTNDLIIYNDTGQYNDAGLLLGNDGGLNLRLSYNLSESKGHILTNSLSIDAPQVFIPNLSLSSLDNPYKNLVIDASGNLAIGYPQFIGDINTTISTINTNINTIDETLTTLSNRIESNTTNDVSVSMIEMYWIYGLCFLVLLLVGFVIYQFIFNNHQQNIILKMRKELDQLKITPDQKGFEESITLTKQKSAPSTPTSSLSDSEFALGKKKLFDYIVNQL
jgi:hypothetical protein